MSTFTQDVGNDSGEVQMWLAEDRLIEEYFQRPNLRNR
jgi:hypothetical protein